MRRFVAAALLLACGASAALAADVIKDRQEMMKGVQAATKDATAIAKGTVPFDAAKVKTILAVYSDAAAKIPGLFPKGTETGSDTTAAPTIWTDAAGFKLAAAKLGTDAKAAGAATDQASFAVAFGAITKDCGGCHGTYRVKKD